MTIIYQELTVGLTKNSVVKTIDMVQGDSGRGLKITLSDNIFTDGETERTSYLATMYAIKPSGLIVEIPADDVVQSVVGNNAYKMQFSNTQKIQNAIVEDGRVMCEVQLKSDTEIVTSFYFYINVIKPATSMDTLLSTSDFGTLVEYISYLKELIERFKIYEDKIQGIARLNHNVFYGTSLPSEELGEEGDIYIQTTFD